MKPYLLGLILLVCLACDQSSSKMHKLANEAVILAFGDSLTYGTGAAAEQDYPSILVELTGYQVINAGVPGEISQQGLQRLPGLLDEYRPALLILMHGGNDILRKLPVEQTRANLKAMIDAARQRNIQVVMLGVPSFSLLQLHSAEFYGELAESEAVVSDLESVPEILSHYELKADTVHPNDKGYRQLAEHVAELLRKQGVI
jgi:lysophospholipase L1-like esterase